MKLDHVLPTTVQWGGGMCWYRTQQKYHYEFYSEVFQIFKTNINTLAKSKHSPVLLLMWQYQGWLPRRLQEPAGH